MRTHRTGLRSEILLTLAILLGSALLLGGFLFLRYAEQNLLQQRTQVTTLGLRLIASDLAEKKLTPSSALPDTLFDLQNQLDARSWWVFDRDLSLQFSYHAGTKVAVPRGLLRQVLFDNREVVELSWPGLLSFFNPEQQSSLLVAVPLKSSVRPQGVLVARFSLEDILAKLVSAQRWLLFYVFAFGAVLVGAGLYLLNRNIVRPTQKLLEATQNIAGGDLSLRLENSGPRELHALATSFNNMVAALEQSHLETERHILSLSRTNHELQRTQDELIRSEKLATVGYLAAGMAHEIGNPLGALTGYLGLLQHEPHGVQNNEILTQAAAAAERIDRLVQELLDYATPSATLTETIDPWIAVKDAVRLLELQGIFKDQRLQWDRELTLPEIRADRHRLEQIIVNLLLNSKDACRVGDQISVTGTASEQEVRICVADSGCGIPPAQLGSVFEPFYTTKAPGEGRGLGLAICQRLVAEAGGQIRCESRPDSGCSFTLTFPRSGATMQTLHD